MVFKVQSNSRLYTSKTKWFRKVNNERMGKETCTKILQTLKSLVSDNIKFRTKSFNQDNEKYFLMVKTTIHHENLNYEYQCTK